jgi:hypothetical protein
MSILAWPPSLQTATRYRQQNSWRGDLTQKIALTGGHFSRCADRQFQDLAQRVQVRIPGPHAIGLPKVNAGGTDTDAFCDFGDRQSTLEASVAKVAGKTGFAGQRCDLLPD